MAWNKGRWTVKDRNGAELNVGDRVVVVDAGDSGERYLGRICTVRAFGSLWMPNEQARIDDGDPKNSDLNTNNFHWSAWVDEKQIVKGGA